MSRDAEQYVERGDGLDDVLRPRPDLKCASCGNGNAVPGMGGRAKDWREIPACYQCTDMLGSEEFEENLIRNGWERMHY